MLLTRPTKIITTGPSRLAKLKPVRGFAHSLHIGLNVLLPIAAYILVRIDFVGLAILLILLSKWQMLAVRVRYWLPNLVANGIDILVAVSLVLFMANTASGWWQLLWLGLYISWLVWLKPRSDVLSVSGQAMTAAGQCDRHGGSDQHPAMQLWLPCGASTPSFTLKPRRRHCAQPAWPSSERRRLRQPQNYYVNGRQLFAIYTSGLISLLPATNSFLIRGGGTFQSRAPCAEKAHDRYGGSVHPSGGFPPTGLRTRSKLSEPALCTRIDHAGRDNDLGRVFDLEIDGNDCGAWHEYDNPRWR